MTYCLGNAVLKCSSCSKWLKLSEQSSTTQQWLYIVSTWGGTQTWTCVRVGPQAYYAHMLTTWPPPPHSLRYKQWSSSIILYFIYSCAATYDWSTHPQLILYVWPQLASKVRVLPSWAQNSFPTASGSAIIPPSCDRGGSLCVGVTMMSVNNDHLNTGIKLLILTYSVSKFGFYEKPDLDLHT